MKKILIILFASLLVISCGKDFLDVNTDPNNPSESTPEVTLPVAQKNSADIIQGGYSSMNTVGNLFMYGWASGPGGVWYTDEMALRVTSSFHAEIWNYTYGTVLKNYNYVAQYDVENYDYFRAIADIMMSYHFQVIVDTYGNAPYTEALARGDNPRPAYDEASLIYEKLLAKLDMAVNTINDAPASAIVPTAVQDIMMNGDMAKWAKFANTLRMKLLVRQSAFLPLTDITAGFAAIDADANGYLAAGESVFCNPGYLKVIDKQNPHWEDYGEDTGDTETLNWKYTKATDYIINKMFATNDFRMDGKFAAPENGGFWVGFGQGTATAGEDNENYSGISKESLGTFSASTTRPELIDSEQDAIIFTAAESLLLQAEAAQKGYTSGDAAALYREGVIASFAIYGLPSSFAEASYLGANGGNPEVDFTAGEPLRAIATQKYMALIGINGLETWLEYNRTGFPNDLPFSATAISTTRPLRLLYPNSEISNNSGNVPAQTNSDAFNSPIFWDN